MLSTHDHPQKSKPTRAESARINGSKSRGAITPEGKLRAAKGNFKHGAYSTRVVMEDENVEAYQELHDLYVGLFLPQDVFENECVINMINARWRLRRIEAAETANLNVATERALATECDAAHIESMTRVEERLHRLYQRNYKLLCNYRQRFGRSMPVPLESNAPAPQPSPSNLTDPPKTPPDSLPTAARILFKVALVLIIFATLFLVPARAAASEGSPSSIRSAVDRFCPFVASPLAG